MNFKITLKPGVYKIIIDDNWDMLDVKYTLSTKNVSVKATKVKMPKKVKVKVGSTKQILPKVLAPKGGLIKKAKWSVSNKKIASIDKKGKVKGKKAGKTKVVLRLPNKTKYSTQVVVSKAAL